MHKSGMIYEGIRRQGAKDKNGNYYWYSSVMK